MATAVDDVLRLGARITLIPVIHGSGDFAFEVRRLLLERSFDCLAVPLPPSFQEDVEAAIDHLPTPSLVFQAETDLFKSEWRPSRDAADDNDDDDDDDSTQKPRASYVPIDPCQPVIAALRVAIQERMHRAFIDVETQHYVPHQAVLPDPYALKKVSIAQFATAVLPALGPPPNAQVADRCRTMAARLRELEGKHRSIACLCAINDWPWIRAAYLEQLSPAEDDDVEATRIFRIDPATLIFFFGELPFITGLYERARAELEDDQNLSIDGVKELLLASRDHYKAELKRRARKITPQMLRLYLRYVRNLSLIEKRMTPDLYTLVIAAKQIAGDQFALHVAETARIYPYVEPLPFNEIELGIGKGRVPDAGIVELANRLPGVPTTWRSCELRPRPEKDKVRDWEMRWNPYSQCSWPPEDEKIEDFRTHVTDRAKALLGIDLARSEKFTTSLKDGLDVRETLRNWHTGELYVKILPPSRGKLDCVVMLFDSPADPRDYPWRTTWFAEHENESTLAFYATDFRKQLVGPGIGMATYGGAMFLFPPRSIPNIWTDKRLDFTETLEERLLAAACLHSSERHVALLSPLPPGAGWRRLAARYGRKWIHLPSGTFSASTIEQLRMVHVLNGHQVRSYAAEFIRKA